MKWLTNLFKKKPAADLITDAEVYYDPLAEIKVKLAQQGARPERKPFDRGKFIGDLLHLLKNTDDWHVSEFAANHNTLEIGFKDLHYEIRPLSLFRPVEINFTEGESALLRKAIGALRKRLQEAEMEKNYEKLQTILKF